MSGPEPREPGFLDDAWAIAKGMGTVFKQTFRRDNTERYPKEIAPIPPRAHTGRHRLNRHDNGLEKCIGCELCALTTTRSSPSRRVSGTPRTIRSTTCAASCVASASRRARLER